MTGHLLANAEKIRHVTHRLPQPFQQKPGVDEVIPEGPVEEPVGSWPDVPGRSAEALPTWTEREDTVAEGFQTSKQMRQWYGVRTETGRSWRKECGPRMSAP